MVADETLERLRNRMIRIIRGAIEEHDDMSGSVYEIITDQSTYEIDIDMCDTTNMIERIAEWIAKDTLIKRVQAAHYVSGGPLFGYSPSDNDIIRA